ncbi:MAG: hypothetical protein P4L41_14770 [Flavipsychrobacter sp.]|nr:hypothetical protein [Flavipsychrobacter sp.]
MRAGTRMTTEFSLFFKGYLDSKPISCFQLGEYFQIDDKLMQQQYKEHISDFNGWAQRSHASDWMKQLLARSRYLL